MPSTQGDGRQGAAEVQDEVSSNRNEQGEQWGMRNVLVRALTSSIQFSNNDIRISNKCPNKCVPLRDLF